MKTIWGMKFDTTMPSKEQLEKEGWVVDEDGKNMLAPMYGVNHTASAKRRIGDKARERGNGKLGTKHTEETKRKMSKSHTGKKRGPHTEEGKRNISNAKKGKRPDWSNITDAERKARSERAKAQWAQGKLGRKKNK